MITEDYTTVSPAYGRDYNSKATAIEAFEIGQDFKLESLGHGGTYCSIRDFAVGTTVSIRYKKLTMVVNHKITQNSR